MASNNFVVVDTSAVLRTENLGQKIISVSGNVFVICSTVVDELDSFKKGSDELNKMARMAIDWLDENFKSEPDKPMAVKGYPGFVMFKNFVYPNNSVKTDLNLEKPDHQIIWIAKQLKDTYKSSKVTVVSEDKNLRLRAKFLGLDAISYIKKENRENKFNESAVSIKTVKIEEKLLAKYYADKNVGIGRNKVSYNGKPLPNQSVLFQVGENKIPFCFDHITDTFREINTEISVAKIKPKNTEQGILIHSLMDPKISLVIVQGISGSGKTLLSMAAAIQQREHFQKIYVARPIVPLNNKDIGYLPGDQKQKIDPYMAPLWDNLEIIIDAQANDRDKNTIRDLKGEPKDDSGHKTNKKGGPKLQIQPLAYIRGRSLHDVFFIVDESQNLNPLEIKTIITRAGNNTKIVFTGDTNQIDTPYLDHESNGLSYLTNKFIATGGDPMVAIHYLSIGERSNLANLANKVL